MTICSWTAWIAGVSAVSDIGYSFRTTNGVEHRAPSTKRPGTRHVAAAHGPRGRQVETQSTIGLRRFALKRSTALLMAAYACEPIDRIRMESDPCSRTVTVHATPAQSVPDCTSRRTARTRRTLSISDNCVSAAKSRYSAYVRACWLIAQSPTTSIRIDVL